MRILLLLFIQLISVFCFASKIKGTVKDTKGEALSFASVIIRGENKGTMANDKGEYVLDVDAGKTYELLVQYVGYKASLKEVKVGGSDVTADFVLAEQSIGLQEVSVSQGKEDPAYSIMRRAIAKSKIHDNQVLSYETDAYIKNTLLLKKAPALLRKQVEKSGIKIGVPFVSESLINFKFTQPNKRVTKVVAKRQSLDQLDISSGFFLINFYSSGSSLDIISPLSPRAFSYYKFEYLGYFEEHGRIINKIKVIPKSYNGDVWKGTIYIIEGLWCIHSVDLETKLDGINMRTQQVYAPNQGVWIPVNQKLEGYGSPLGFDFNLKMQVNPKYKSLKINTKYVAEVVVLDEKKPHEIKKKKNTDEVLKTQKEFSLKEMNRLAKMMEKEKRVETKDVVREDSVTVDSLAAKRSDEFWGTVRSIPLSVEENQSFKIRDSIVLVREEKRDSLRADSLKKSWRRYVFGGTFPIKRDEKQFISLNYKSPLVPFLGVNYNIVEGLTSQMDLELKKVNRKIESKDLTYSLNSQLRYAFGQQRLMYTLGGEASKNGHSFGASGGSFRSTFDPNQNMPEYINTIFNFFGYNLSQIYRKDFVKLGYGYTKGNRFSVSSNVEVANRQMLYNMPEEKIWFNARIRNSNTPENLELGNSSFGDHTAVLWKTSLSYTPGSKYRIYNGRKINLRSDWPVFRLNYTKGFNDVDFDFVSLGARQNVKTGFSEYLKYTVEVGGFPNSKKLHLMDMRHINSVTVSGNLNANSYDFYRMLNTDLPIQFTPDSYYRYSTKGTYVKFHAINEFRKLAVTQIPSARVLGLKEDLFVNYLNSPLKKNYTEVGYGIDGIFKVLRFEVITSFEKGQPQRWGWQIGVNL